MRTTNIRTCTRRRPLILPIPLATEPQNMRSHPTPSMQGPYSRDTPPKCTDRAVIPMVAILALCRRRLRIIIMRTMRTRMGACNYEPVYKYRDTSNIYSLNAVEVDHFNIFTTRRNPVRLSSRQYTSLSCKGTNTVPESKNEISSNETHTRAEIRTGSASREHPKSSQDERWAHPRPFC
jgi:hypothetical protein